MTVTTASRRTDRSPRSQRRVSSRLVVGTVQRFRHDRGFGFASIDDEQGEVFLHNSYGRVAIGTPDQPMLTRTITKVDVTDASTANPSRVVMLIVPDSQGLKAIAWGLIPTGDWSKCVFDTLKEYIGGVVSTGRVSGNSFPGPEFSGTLQLVTIDCNVLEIVLGDAQQRNGRGHYVPLTNPSHLTLAYDLTSARADNTLPKGRFAIRLPEEDTERQLTFNPPEQN